MADYFAHWFEMGDRLGSKAPRIFYVNWFRKSPEGRWLWPGFGDNSRVLKWMCERLDGQVQGRETPIGFLPYRKDLDLTGLTWKEEFIEELLTVHEDEWRAEVPDIERFFSTFGDRLPERLKQQLREMQARLG